MKIIKLAAAMTIIAVLPGPVPVPAASAGGEIEVLTDYKGKRILPNNPKDEYIYCRLKAAMDAKREGLDFWAAKKAGMKICEAPAAVSADKTISKSIVRSIAKYYEGE